MTTYREIVAAALPDTLGPVRLRWPDGALTDFGTELVDELMPTVEHIALSRPSLVVRNGDGSGFIRPPRAAPRYEDVKCHRGEDDRGRWYCVGHGSAWPCLPPAAVDPRSGLQDPNAI